MMAHAGSEQRSHAYTNVAEGSGSNVRSPRIVRGGEVLQLPETSSSIPLAMPTVLKPNKRHFVPFTDSLRTIRERYLERNNNVTDTPPPTDKSNELLSRCKSLLVILQTLATAGLFVYMFCFLAKLQRKNEELGQTVNTLQSYLDSRSNFSKICLPCEELTQGPFEEDNPGLSELTKEIDRGVTVCCAQGPHQMLVLLSTFAKRKMSEKLAYDELNGTSSACNTTGETTETTGLPALQRNVEAIHLTANPHLNLNGGISDDTYSPIRNWIIGKPGSHSSGIRTVGYDGSYDKLVVPETGIYYLYSQVGFLFYYDNPDDPQANDGTHSIFLTVFRYNVIYPTGNESLLKSGITQCWERQKQYGRYTSYVGGAVKLNKGDQIYVSVTKIRFLLSDPSLTYFGMYKIS